MQNIIPVIIGRFQPFHNNHKKLIDFAIQDTGDTPIILIGSSFQSRSVRNPFTFEERKKVLEKVYPNAVFEPIMDYLENSVWGEKVKEVLKKYDQISNFCFYGDCLCNKLDREILGEIKTKDFKAKDNIRATMVRDYLYNLDYHKVKPCVPQETFNFLEGFDKNILKELNEVRNRNTFTQGIYVTVDNIVLTKEKQILLIKRKDNNLYALAGGYLEKEETTKEGALRELKEETGIDRKDINLIDNFYVDNIYRSSFGRLITFVYVWGCKKLLTLKGGDDAKKAIWYEINQLDEIKERFHDDHYQIIYEYLRRRNNA